MMKPRLLICFCAIMLISCNSRSQDACIDIFNSCKNGLSTATNLDADEILSHFPEIMCSKKHQRILAIPLFGDNSGGLMYSEQISSMQIKAIKANYSFKDSILYYAPNAFRIRHFIFNDTVTSFDTSVLSRSPVPTFYLGLNKDGKIHEEWLHKVDSVKVSEKQTVYIAPKDLMIYIIDAKDGYFWKEEDRDLPRPFLGEWTFGYSKGIAISEKEKIICYWVMIW